MADAERVVGCLLLTHAGLGQCLLDCAAHVLGSRQRHVGQVGVGHREEPRAIERRARALLDTLDQGSGVIILTDIYGATPSNVAARLIEPGRIEAVAGVSLPMFLRVLNYRQEPLATVLAKALSGGVEGVVQISTTMVPHGTT